MEKHQKVSLGAECFSDNSEKTDESCSKGLQDIPLQVPKKAWTDRGAERGKMEKKFRLLLAWATHGKYLGTVSTDEKTFAVGARHNTENSRVLAPTSGLADAASWTFFLNSHAVSVVL